MLELVLGGIFVVIIIGWLVANSASTYFAHEEIVEGVIQHRKLRERVEAAMHNSEKRIERLKNVEEKLDALFKHLKLKAKYEKSGLLPKGWTVEKAPEPKYYGLTHYILDEFAPVKQSAYDYLSEWRSQQARAMSQEFDDKVRFGSVVDSKIAKHVESHHKHVPAHWTDKLPKKTQAKKTPRKVGSKK